MNRVLQVVLTGNANSLRGVLAQSAAEVKSFQRTVEQSNNSVAASAKRTGASFAAIAGGATALTVALGYSVAKAAEFEASMRNVNSLAKLSEESLGTLSDQVIEMSTRLPQSANILAQGLYDVVGSGFEAADAMTVLDAAAQAASAGMTTTEVSAGAIGAAINAYGLEAADATDISDILFQTVNLGVMSFDELAGSVGDVVGTAAAAKVGLDQVGAAIATMTLTGISGAEASTSLNNLMQSMIKPSEALSEAFTSLGYESGAQALEQDGLRVVIERLAEATGGEVTALLELFPNIRAARGALALMSAEGTTYARVSGELEDKNKRQGATAAVLAEQMKATSNQFALLKNQFNAGAIIVGTKVLPILNTLMGVIQEGAGWVGSMAGAIAQRLTPAWDALARAGAAVVDILVDTAKVVGPVVGGFAALAGGAVVASLTALLNVTASLLETISGSPAVTAAFVAVLAALALKATGATLAMSLLWTGMRTGQTIAAVQAIGFTRLGTALQSMSTFARSAGLMIRSAGAAAMGSVQGMAAFGLAAQSARVALVGLMTAAAPLAAIAVAAYAITSMQQMGHRAREARDEVHQMWDAVEGADTNTERFSAVTSGVDAMRQKVEEARASVEELGGSEFTASDSLDHFWSWDAKGDWEDQRAALADYEEALQKVEAEAAAYSATQDALQRDLGLTSDEVNTLADEFGLDLTDATGVARAQFEALYAQKYGDAPKAGVVDMIDALGTLADTGATAKEQIDALKQALDILGGGDVWAANAALQEAVAKSVGGLGDVAGRMLDDAGGLDAYTEAGRAAGEMLIGVRDHGNDLIVSMIENGESVERVIGANADLRDSFLQTADNMGIPAEAAQRLADDILGIPADRESAIRAAVTGGEDVGNLQAQIDGLRDRTVTINTIIKTTDGTTAVNTHGQVIIAPNSAPSMNAPVPDRRHGGLINFESYADGGLRFAAMASGGRLPTVAGIANEQTNLVQWAEPGTGGEAFVPLGDRNSPRSLELVSWLNGWFGMEKYANGGIRTPAAAAGYGPGAVRGSSGDLTTAVAAAVAAGRRPLIGEVRMAIPPDTRDPIAELFHRLRVIDHGGVYAGVTG